MSHARFKLEIDGLPSTYFQEVMVKYAQQGLSQDYAFQVIATVPSALNNSLPKLCHAHLSAHHDDSQMISHGVLTTYQLLQRVATGYQYRLTLRSPLHSLKGKLHSRCYVDQTPVAIAESVLRNAGWGKHQYCFRLTSPSRVRAFTMQYQECDYDFLDRLFAHCGWIFYFEQDAHHARLVITDQLLPNKMVSLRYRPNAQFNPPDYSVSYLTESLQLLPKQVMLTDHNPQTPEACLDIYCQSKSPLAHNGSLRVHGLHYSDSREGNALAQILLAQIDWQRRVQIAKTDCPLLMPGIILRITDHPQTQYNADYRILSADYDGSLYQLVLVPLNVSFKKTTAKTSFLKQFSIAQPCAEKPYFPHTLRATVIGHKDGSAQLNEQGAYVVRWPFETESDRSHHPIPLLRSNTNIHFPLLDATQVIVGFINGDMDRPIILGCIPDNTHPSPVTNANSSQNIMQSAGDNRLLMDDAERRHLVCLSTKDRHQRLRLDASGEKEQIEFANENGEIRLNAGEAIKTEAANSQQCTISGNYQVDCKQSYFLLSQSGKIAFTTEQACQLIAGQHMLLNAGGVLGITSKHAIRLRTQYRNQLTSQGNITLTGQTGLSLTGSKHIAILAKGHGDLIITNHKATIKITQGKLTLKANKIIIESPLILQGL